MHTCVIKDERAFPIICLGGSAGGFDAYKRFLANFPPDTGGAVVVVTHARIVPTQLHESLPQYTRMPVRLIEDGLSIERNHVYVIPTARDLTVANGAFVLRPLSKITGWPNVITIFLQSIAEHWKGRSIAVILSGLDSDGAAALKSVKGSGGVTFAQDPQTAQQEDMPRNATETGDVDYVLSPEHIAVKVAALCTAV